ncbi:MAG: hypothetical protein ACJAXQ_000415 [Parvibaculaceae bacterium]|jgi:hypothetical protein
MLLGGAVGVAMVASAGTANALDYKLGGVDVVVDTTVSLGTAVRASAQSCDKISEPNGGCLGSDGYAYGANDDDGNVNFSAGDFVSAAVKATTDFEARYENFGAFARVKVFYDYINDQEAGQNGGSDRFGERPMADPRRGDDFLNAGAHDISLLDAFVFANFTVAGDLPLTIRVGQQVNNWGESLVIGGGINSYLSFDVSALRTPGSELKEAVLPALSAYASIGLPYNFNLEGWYSWRHDEVKLDNCGTFFSSHDGVCNGGAYLMNKAEYSAAADAAYNLPFNGVTQLGGLLLNRAKDDDANDGGEFGVKLGYYADWLNDGTDLGIYFTNFHSKAPIATFTTADQGGIANFATSCQSIAGGASSAALSAGNCLAPATSGGYATHILLNSAATVDYLVQYVEDIRMVGASFNTAIDILGGTALAGEVAYSPNMPFQISDPEITGMSMDRARFAEAAALIGNPGSDLYTATGNAAGSIDRLVEIMGSAAGTSPVLTSWDSLVGAGDAVQGYRRTKVLTGQLQTTSTLPASDPIVSVLDADLLILLSNVGFQYLPDLDGMPNHFAIPGAGAYHDNALIDGFLGQGKGVPSDASYASSFSWGYRLIAAAQYNNFMGSALTVTPSIQWAHDVSGYSAGPIGPGFVEGKKTISLGASATYQSAYKAEIRYTNSFGNKFRNKIEDKDFASINFSYAF